MKLHLDMTGKRMTVTREPEAKRDQSGEQRIDKQTGHPMWSTQLLVLDEDGGTIITVTTAAEKGPDVRLDDVVLAERMEAIPWATNGRSGCAYRAEHLTFVDED